MCGIAGIVFKHSNDKYEQYIHKMTDLVMHRGPDNGSVYVGDGFAFGHRRLSIIDTSDSANQPMVYRDKYVITYNGEIYNYLEIRKELEQKGYSFKTKSDTEVVLASYDRWKEECVNKFDGMFAFGIYDIANKKLFIARDRYGVKPLYFFYSDDEFYFFSEPKQVIISGIKGAIPNYEVIEQYLAFQFSLNNKTMFKDIYKIEPGYYGIYKDDKFSTNKYWSIDDISESDNVCYKDAENMINNLVINSVERHLIADVKVGSYLSSGIDSSVISTVAAKFIDKIDTYTFTSKKIPALDESTVAFKTSKKIGSNHHEIELEFSDVLNIWERAIYYMDEPEVGYSLIAQMAISEKVSRDLKVILGGQGGDELFSGYGWYNYIILNNLRYKFSDINLRTKFDIIISAFINRPLNKIKSFFSSKHNVQEDYFNMWVQNSCFDLVKNKKNLKEQFLKKLGFDGSIKSIRKFEFKYWLRGLLHVEDRSSMAFSLESRVPLIDNNQLVNYVFSIPTYFTLDGSTNKKIFKNAFKRDLVVDVFNNKNKKGYVCPINKWLIDPSVAAFIDNIFKNKESFIFNFIDRNILYTDLTERQKWLLVSLEIWHNIFVKKEKVPC